MHEADDELRDIKREIIESRGLVIKTNNLTNALSADIKSIAKRQQGYERRLAWNSATAYVVFVVVVFAALKFAVDARVDAIDATAKHLRDENARLKTDLDESRQREAERNAAEIEAAKFYELVKEGRRIDVIRGWDAMKAKPLTRSESQLFAEAVQKAKIEQATLLYLQGLDSSRLQRWQEAAGAYEESLRYAEREAPARDRVPQAQKAEGGHRHSGPPVRAGRGPGGARRRAGAARVVPDGDRGVQRREEHVAHAAPQVPRLALRAGSEARPRDAHAESLAPPHRRDQATRVR